MLKLAILLILFATPVAAQTESYLVLTSQAACQARSQAQCQLLGCDGVHTVYWWDCGTGPLMAGLIGLNTVPSGAYGLQIDASGPYGKTTSNVVSPTAVGLSSTEQLQLVTAVQLAPLEGSVQQQVAAK
jgi:hypothetical protein